MKSLRNMILIACVFCASPKIFAADRIEEHFGIKLGQVFDPATALATNSPSALADKPQEPEYQVPTPSNIQPFDTLFVQITPASHKIYRIIARGDKVTAQQKEDVKANLQQKFPGDQRATRRMSVRSLHTAGDPAVEGKFIPRKVTTSVVYWDIALQDLAQKERPDEKSP